MEPTIEKQLLVADYLSLATILRHKGLDFVEITDEQLDAMRSSDLRPIVANMRDLARTPTS